MTYGITGFGAFKAGLAPAGVGTPVTAPAAPTVVFRNADLSSPSQSQLSGRKIDAVARQYVFDASGTIVGESTVQQLVMLAWSTAIGTSAVTTLGHALSSVRMIGPSIQRQVSSILTAAVQPYIDQKLMVITSLTVDRFNQSGVYVRIRWRDLTTNTEHPTDLPLASA